MDPNPALSPSDPTSIRVATPEPVDVYLARLAEEQARFLAAWTDVNRGLDRSSGQLAKVASIQLRLTQEFLDAQRSIIRRRAQTDLEVAAIAAAAADEAAALLNQAAEVAAVSVGTPTPAPPPPTSPMEAPVGFELSFGATWFPQPGGWNVEPDPVGDSESLARLIDGAFEPSEPDGVAARRELRDLLDGWWHAENQEAQAAIDDATARAAMQSHVARVEASELARFAPPVPCVVASGLPMPDVWSIAAAPAPRAAWAPPAGPSMAVGLPTPVAPPTASGGVSPFGPPSGAALVPVIEVRRPLAAQAAPLVSALDATDHEHLDDVLAHLLDGLQPVAAPAVDAAPSIDVPAPAPVDSLNDQTAEPQEAFDRFWGALSGPGRRAWIFPQLLLPAVAVVAVVALVLAVIG